MYVILKWACGPRDSTPPLHRFTDRGLLLCWMRAPRRSENLVSSTPPTFPIHPPISSTRCPRPLDPFPNLIRPAAVRRHEPAKPRPLPTSSFHQRIIAQLNAGARILFDIEQRRGLIYTVRQGIRHLGEITVRTLGRMVRQGILVVTGREGRIVHYGLATGLGRL